eukprot:GFKZ01007371.1.p1 GENE.GFKZ01007371.1~~GFKZ01007371.1.p1  ORF type:complete len:576 (-),score=73.20 GFKZ01007371.1:59-1603(-)
MVPQPPTEITESIPSIHSHLRSNFSTGVTLPLSFRLSQLRLLRKFLHETENQFLSALHSDLHKPHLEAIAYDISPITVDIAYYLRHLSRLARPKYQNKAFSGPVYTEHQPLGVVLIFGPFNFPIQLIIRPLVAAIAAGNAICLKPSEITTNSERYISQLQDVLDSRVFRVVTGGPQVCTELLELKWDHILFTGSSAIGRIVMTAAAKHLTPVTLELGGKNPAIVTESAHVQTAARSILRARMTNCGQFCLAADYCLVDDSIYDEFVKELPLVLEEFYGGDPKSCEQFGRMVSSRHVKRLVEYMQKTTGRVLVGGDYDDASGHYFAPTVVEISNEDDVLMKEEVFGPILPIFRVKSTEDSLRIILAKEKPLAMYIFCTKDQVKRDLLDKVTSGSAAVNDAVWQIGGDGAFIGGVGESGMGRYGLGEGFETFSHKRLVLHGTPRAAAKASMMNPNHLVRSNWILEWSLRVIGYVPFPNSDGVPFLEKMKKRMPFIAATVAGAILVPLALRRKAADE